MNIALIEQDINVTADFKEKIKETISDANIFCFNNADKFIDAVYNSDKTPDAIFSCTKLGQVNVISLLYGLQKKIKHVPVIFLTDSYESDCQNIFLESAFFKPFALMVKPLQQNILDIICSQLSMLSSYKKSTIKVKSEKKKSTFLHCAKITYVESDKRQLTIHSTEQNKKIYGKLKDFKETLPDYFAMPHSSFIVNLNCIRSYDSVSVTLTDNTVIPISKSKKETFLNKLLFYRNYNLNFPAQSEDII